MLILTRKNGESLLVGDDVRIVVTEARYGKVKIGIEAPREMLIRRGELVEDWEDRGQQRSAG